MSSRGLLRPAPFATQLSPAGLLARTHALAQCTPGLGPAIRELLSYRRLPRRGNLTESERRSFVQLAAGAAATRAPQPEAGDDAR